MRRPARCQSTFTLAVCGLFECGSRAFRPYAHSVFHVAPSSAREDILTEGLLPSEPRPGLPAGVYVFEDIENAWHYAQYREQLDSDEYGPADCAQDIWQVNPGLLPAYTPDPDVDPDDEFCAAYPVQPLRSFFSAAPISATAITLVEPADREISSPTPTRRP